MQNVDPAALPWILIDRPKASKPAPSEATCADRVARGRRQRAPQGRALHIAERDAEHAPVEKQPSRAACQRKRDAFTEGVLARASLGRGREAVEGWSIQVVHGLGLGKAASAPAQG
jgi:hypothetical protein